MRTLMALLFLWIALPAAGSAQRLALQVDDPMGASRPERVYEAPEIINRIEIERVMQTTFPNDLWQRQQGGQVVISFKVDEFGWIDRTTLTIVSSDSPALSTAAREVFRRLHVTPGFISDGPDRYPSAMRVTLPLTWVVK